MILATPPTEVKARRQGHIKRGGRGHSVAQGHGLGSGCGQSLGRGRYGSQGRGRVPKAYPGPGPGCMGEAGAQLLLSLGNSAGKAAAIPGKLLPGAPAGSLGRSCPDSQEMDGDLLREAHLETDQHRHGETQKYRHKIHRAKGERGEREREREPDKN